MTPDQERKLDEVHDFLLKPTGPGKPSRAEQLDDALAGVRAGKITARFILWISGFMVAIVAAWNSLKGGSG